MTDESNDDEMTKREAFEAMAAASGQAIIESEKAHGLLQPFVDDVVDDYLRDHGLEEKYRSLIFAQRIEAEQVTVREEGLITSAPAYETVLSMAEVSAVLVESIGREPSDVSMAGTGFTYDARHDENVEIIGDTLDVDGEDVE